MESLPNLPLLCFNENTLQEARKEINLDKPGRMEQALDILEDWVKKQSHFQKKDFPREYLERTILTSKGLIERAKMRLDKYCTFRTMMPEFFDHSNFEETYSEIKSIVIHAHMPKMTSENYRVHMTKLTSADCDSGLLFKYFKYLIVLGEYFKINDYALGFVIIADLSDVNLVSLLPKVNVVELRQILTILMEGFGLRLKGIHFITSSKMIDSVITIFKSILSEKVSNRIQVHRKLDTLYEHVNKDCLPVEYGGEQKSVKVLQDEWFNTLNSEEFQSYLKELESATINESYRHTVKFNEECIGMPGSFRTLSVD